MVPPHCFGCNDVLYRGEHVLCAFCRNELPLTDYNFRDENAVDRIFYGRCSVIKAGALLYYSENSIVQRLIHGLKYRGLEQTATYLGACYGAALSREPVLRGVDFVLPVPLHKNKARKRGYNQCARFGTGNCLATWRYLFGKTTGKNDQNPYPDNQRSLEPMEGDPWGLPRPHSRQPEGKKRPAGGRRDYNRGDPRILLHGPAGSRMPAVVHCCHGLCSLVAFFVKLVVSL